MSTRLDNVGTDDLLVYAYGALVVASTAACAYHGYKRNDSAGWGLGWGILGASLPVAAPVVALLQGFAKPSEELRLTRLERGQRIGDRRRFTGELSSSD